MSKTKSISCGDWHLGWGYGGNDKIGRLSSDDGVNFTWKGSSQGRHGQKWNTGAKCTFKLGPNDKIEIYNTIKGSAPKIGRVTEVSRRTKNKNQMKPQRELTRGEVIWWGGFFLLVGIIALNLLAYMVGAITLS